MPRRRGTAFKVRVVLEVLLEQKTLAELGSELGVHPVQISRWKKPARDGLPEVFGSRGSQATKVEEDLELQPREMGGAYEKSGSGVYRRTPAGLFEPGPDANGRAWRLTTPVSLVDWNCARRYAQWRAEKDGLPWRLVGDFEWEKAARGADGRSFPWGNHLDHSQVCCLGAFSSTPEVCDVTAFEGDCSVYGVRGLSGNVRDWCAEKQTVEAEVLSYGGLVPRPEKLEPQPRLAVRGGGWDGGDVAARSAFRGSDILTRRCISLGFRLARSVEGDP